jgi:hypothetical protein
MGPKADGAGELWASYPVDTDPWRRRFRMRRIAGLSASVVVTAIIATAAPTFACFGGIIEVAQPLVDSEGILVRVVSLSRNCVPTSVVPGYEVEFVGEPSFVRDEGHPDTAENLNAANFLGIRTDIDPFHGRTSRLLGDTLHVVVDLTAVPTMTEELRRRLLGWSIDDVIKATVESVLLTAYWHRRGILAAYSIQTTWIRSPGITGDSAGIHPAGWKRPTPTYTWLSA